MVNISTEIEKALYETKEFLLSVIGESPFGVLGIDLEGKIIVVNYQLIEILGKNLDVDKLIGQDVKKIIEGIPELVKVINICVTRGRKSFDLHSVEIKRKKEGVFLSIKGRLIRVGMLIVIEDITAEAAAAAAERALEQQKEIDKAKTEFVSLASHQLRTPLTGIEWTAELFAKKEKLTKEGMKYLADIRFSARRLNALIKLLLNVSRIESGGISVSPEPLELVEFINKYIRESQMSRGDKKLSLIFVKHPEKLTIATDKNMFGYIIQNLFSNAVNYTLPEGKVEISLEKKENSVLLLVRDTGIGIPEKEQEHIFKKFTRASNAVAIKTDGSGLGLYIVSESVKLLGGRIWFESKENKGTTFYVELPLKSVARLGESKLVDKL